MKLIINQGDYVESINDLKDIDVSGFDISNGDFIKYCTANDKTYIYQPSNVQQPESICPTIGAGTWEEQDSLVYRLLKVETQDFNPALNNDIDITSLDNWINYGIKLVGKFKDFKDWKCLRDTILAEIRDLAGVDLANYEANLSDTQKAAALEYIPTQIITHKGLVFIVAECGGDLEKVNGYIDNFIDQTKGNIERGLAGAYKKRWRAAISFFYNNVGMQAGLKLARMANADGVRHLWTNYGVTRFDEDGVSGFYDWLEGLNEFTGAGARAFLEDPANGLTGVIDIDQFLIDAAAILESGKY